MTGLLKDVMHDRADSLDAPDLDVAAMLRDGSRTVEADLAISALVQGPSGYVVADRQGRVHTVVDGESQQVGLRVDPDRGRLVSDDDVVAWVDAADGGTLSVLDLATGDRVDVPVADLPGDPVSPNAGSIGGAGADIVAVDGRTVYVPDARGLMAWDALDGEILQVATSFEPQEVDGSTTMVQVEELRSGPDLLDTRSLPGTGGALSPDGQRAVLTPGCPRRTASATTRRGWGTSTGTPGRRWHRSPTTASSPTSGWTRTRSPPRRRSPPTRPRARTY